MEQSGLTLETIECIAKQPSAGRIHCRVETWVSLCSLIPAGRQT